LTLAEVEVFSRGQNIAGQGEATQSSTDFNAPAGRALDGNKSGVFADRGQTHTKQQKDPWWELDLREEQPIDSIVLWTRSEENGKYADRLQNFKVTVFDGHKKPAWTKENQPAPRESARFSLDANPAERLRHAAMNAVVTIPGHEAEVFATLVRFFREDNDRDAAIKALRRLPRNKLPKDQLKPLAEGILAHVGTLPAKQRTEPNVMDELQLGSDLAGLLGDEGKTLAAQFSKLGVQVVLIRTIPHNVAYDVAEFYVEANKPVVLVLENPDVAPHNLVIAQPGSLTEVGQAAELLATNPNAFAMGFVPKHPKVLFASRMLQPRETDRMQITAPAAPGKYVFVCTFPGHYPVMNGIMHVVPDLSVIPSTDRVKALEDKKWKVEELAGDLDKLDAGRSFARGKELFKLRTCSQCHKIGGEGGALGGTLGPDLSELPKKLAGKDFARTHLLTEILEPSKVIDKKYKVWRFLMDDGRPIDGIILEESKTTITIAKNAVEKPMDIKVDALDSKVELKNSFMPEGLLSRMNREDILDLLAYIAAGGDASHPAFRGKE
jgi:putative heme-binding domain-containing protein